MFLKMDISIIRIIKDLISIIKDLSKIIKDFKDYNLKDEIRELLKDVEKQKVIYESYINNLRNIYNIKSRDSYCLVILPNDLKKMAANLDEIPFLICEKNLKSNLILQFCDLIRSHNLKIKEIKEEIDKILKNIEIKNIIMLEEIEILINYLEKIKEKVEEIIKIGKKLV